MASSLFNIKNYDVAKLFIRRGADVNEKNTHGRTPLHECLKFDIAKLLIANGAKVNTKDNKGNTPIMARRYMNTAIVKLLIRNNANIYNINKYGANILFYCQTVNVITMLFEKYKMNPNIRDNKGLTPLMCKNCRYHPEIFDSFIKYGADVKARDTEGRTLLMIYEDVDTLKKLIATGLNVNDVDDYGRSAIFYHKSLPVIDFLITNGADVNITDYKGMTALSYHKDDNEIVNLLLSHGAKPENEHKLIFPSCNHKMYTETIIENEELRDKLFKHYIKFEHIEAAIKEGIDVVNLRRRDGRTPLMYCEDYNIARYLIERGADVNARDNKGRTALFYQFRADTVRLLIANGANVNAIDDEGRTPLMFHCSEEIIGMLIKHGADINAKDNTGREVINCRNIEYNSGILKMISELKAKQNAAKIIKFADLI